MGYDPGAMPKKVPPASEFGQRLYRLRTERGLTQIQLATLAEVHWRTILRWESGQVPIPALAARGLRQLLAEQKKGRRLSA